MSRQIYVSKATYEDLAALYNRLCDFEEKFYELQGAGSDVEKMKFSRWKSDFYRLMVDISHRIRGEQTRVVSRSG